MPEEKIVVLDRLLSQMGDTLIDVQRYIAMDDEPVARLKLQQLQAVADMVLNELGYGHELHREGPTTATTSLPAKVAQPPSRGVGSRE